MYFYAQLRHILSIKKIMSHMELLQMQNTLQHNKLK